MFSTTCIIPSLCSNKSYPILKKCIYSLKRSAEKAGVSIDIVIVSNGKNIVLKELAGEIGHLIKTQEPYSFSKMNNIAIDRAMKIYDPNWLLLINDDAFVDINFFSNFSKIVSEHKSCEVITPLIYEGDTQLIDSFGIEYFNSGYAKNSTSLHLDTQLATAACLLISKKTLQKTKESYGFYFNEILGSYLEDVDFSLRIRGIGKKICKAKNMAVRHMVSFTNKRRSKYVIYQTYRNIIWLIIMNWPINSIIKNLPNIILVQLWTCFYSTFTKGPFMFLRIWIDTLVNFPKLWKLRKNVLRSYNKDFNFETVLSRYAFRTYHGYKIRIGGR